MCRCLGFSNTLTQFPSISIQQRTCFIQLVLKQNPQSSPLYHSLTEGVFHQFPGASGGGAYEAWRHYRAPAALRWRRIQTFWLGLWACRDVRVGVLGDPVGRASVGRREDPGSWGAWCQRRRMAPTTTVSQRKLIKRKAPRGFLKRVFKRRKPHLRLTTDSDLLVRFLSLLELAVGREADRGDEPQTLFHCPQPF